MDPPQHCCPLQGWHFILPATAEGRLKGPVSEMVSSFIIECDLELPREALWKVRGTSEFMDFLVSSGALNRMSSSAEGDGPTPGTRSRTLIYVPKTMDIPPAVRPVFDDTFLEINDTQTWDDAAKPFEQTFTIRPGVLEEYVATSGSLRLLEADVPRDGIEGTGTVKGCRHILSGECCVSIPLIGWYIEQAIIANMNTFYGDYPLRIREFKNMVLTKYGDGSEDALHAVFDRMVAEEKPENVPTS